MKVTTKAAFVCLLGTLLFAVIAGVGISLLKGIFVLLMFGFCIAGSIVAFKLLNGVYVERGEDILCEYKKKVGKEARTNALAKKKMMNSLK